MRARPKHAAQSGERMDIAMRPDADQQEVQDLSLRAFILAPVGV